MLNISNVLDYSRKVSKCKFGGEICNKKVILRLNMAKYARPRSLSGSRPRKLGLLYRSKTSGGHISPYSVYNL